MEISQIPHWFILSGIVVFCTTAYADDDAGKKPPNVVIVVADDLGWNDVSFHDAPFDTPNLDALAQRGVELTNFYSCPVCSPTRAGLMTGRWPIRFGLMRAVIPPYRDYGLPVEERTLAEALGEAGYVHRGIFGKWHLGHLRPEWHPLNQGFTEFYGHLNGAIDYFSHERDGELDWHRNQESSDDEGYSTDLIAREACAFVDRHADGESPFLMYVPFNAPHGPLQALEDDLKVQQHLKKPNRQKLAAMTVALDRAIGEIVATIEKKGIRDETVIWFFSDNGGHLPASSNRPWRGQKADVYEGGVRVPAVVSWPGTLPEGTKNDDVMGYIDVMPTVCDVARCSDSTVVDSANGASADLPPFDGISVLNALRDEAPLPERTWYHFIAQSGDRGEKVGVLEGPWKLVVQGGNLLREDQKSQLSYELFNLEKDPLERENLARAHAEVVENLMAKAIAFRQLQPRDHIPPYGEGGKGFVAPEKWQIPANN